MRRVNEARGEDALAAFALHKAVVFLIYSLLTVTLGMGLGLFVGEYLGLPNRTTDALGCAFVLVLEAALLALVVRGALPGSRDEFVQPFSEKRLAAACSALSAATWIFAGLSEQGQIVRVVTNGSLFIFVAVYFAVKSYFSERMRWAVLSVLLLPALELCFEWSRRGR